MASTAPFPADFVWGVATSAYQIEGAIAADGRGPSIWDTFCRMPGKIHDSDTGETTCDHYRRWSEDIGLLRDLGVKAYRFSISWPRVLPEGRGRVNPAGLDFYERLVDALQAAGIEPYPTLYHWDLPQALQDRGGWPARDTATAFADYAGVVVRRLGDRVRHWTTHNEPMIVTVFGHVTGIHAPGIKDPRAALQTAHHLLLSHGLAAQAIRALAPAAQVGIALNLQPVDPASASTEDTQAARRFDGFANRWFLEPLFRGEYPEDVRADFGPLAPAVHPGDMETIRAPLDFLGVNYYSRLVVRHAAQEPLLQAVQVEPEGVERSLMWEIYPQGLGRLLERLASDYQPRAILITENGMPLMDQPDARGVIDDGPRIGFLRRHLEQLRNALGAGVPVRGYFVWSFLDNFEWSLGYRMRFGLVHVDFATQKRTPKASAGWYSAVIRDGIWNG